MRTWKKYRVGELYEVSSGLSKPRSEFGFGHPFVTFKDVFDNYFLPERLTALANTSEKEILSCSVKRGDIFLTRTSETSGELGMSSVALKDYENATFNGFTKRLRLKTNCNIEIDPVYIGYYLRSSSFRNQIYGHATMTTRASLNSTAINSLEIKVPDVKTQVAVGEILKSLDDKITLNRQVNQIMEQLAQTLFKKYFVDNIDPYNLPEGWKTGKLGEIIELTYGKALKESDRRGGPFPVVGSSGIVGYHNEFLGEANGIVVGRKGNAGSVIWLHDNFYPIDTTYFVKDLLQVQNLHFHYFLLDSLGLRGLNSDSAVPGLNRNDALLQEIIIPAEDIILKFNEKVFSLFERIKVNLKEITALTEIRDALLPKLLSGEISVNSLHQNQPLHEAVLS